jgi:hypothetical protein
MNQRTHNQRLPENRRQEVFSALVDAQDHGSDVAHSRKLMVQRFGVSESQVRQIELEGMENQWPPLGIKQKAHNPPVLNLFRPPA